MFSKSKLRKVKSVNDAIDAYHELQQLSRSLIDTSVLDYSTALSLYKCGLLDVNELEYIANTHQADYDVQRKINEIKFRNEKISYEAYVENNIEIDKKESIENSKQKPIGINVDKSEWVVDPYILENIEYQYQKAKLDLSFRMHKMDYYDYQIKMADLNNDPYATVMFEPDYENNTKSLNVSARFNDIFIEELSNRGEFTPQKDDDGNIMKDDLVEQWFSTAIIVMAANMLKETDLDIFRSVTNDNPGSTIIEELQFDDKDLEKFDEIEKQQLKEIEQHGRFYH